MKELLVYILLCTFSLTIVPSYAQGYYWRDYTGEIPADALPGGRDENGKPIYIGQALYSTRLIPAKIYSYNKISFELNLQEINSASDVKILCTQHPMQFEWIATNNEGIKLLTNKHLVKGGFNRAGTTTYIGRVEAEGEVAVGKVLADIDKKAAGMYFTKGQVLLLYTDFEVLSFNSSAYH